MIARYSEDVEQPEGIKEIDVLELECSRPGEATVYRGHEGVREMFRDLSEAFAEIHIETPAIQDLGNRIVATGHIRSRGAESGVETKAPFAYLADVKSGKAIRVRAYLDRIR
jgi:ketosteroid isomerase-like protein